MMKEEFEERIGEEVGIEVYDQLIEPVYCAYDRFDTKEAVAEFWKKEGYPGFRILKEPLAKYVLVKAKIRQTEEEIKALHDKISELASINAERERRLRAMEIQYQLSPFWGKSV